MEIIFLRFTEAYLSETQKNNFQFICEQSILLSRWA